MNNWQNPNEQKLCFSVWLFFSKVWSCVKTCFGAGFFGSRSSRKNPKHWEGGEDNNIPRSVGGLGAVEAIIVADWQDTSTGRLGALTRYQTKEKKYKSRSWVLCRETLFSVLRFLLPFLSSFRLNPGTLKSFLTFPLPSIRMNWRTPIAGQSEICTGQVSLTGAASMAFWLLGLSMEGKGRGRRSKWILNADLQDMEHVLPGSVEARAQNIGGS